MCGLRGLGSQNKIDQEMSVADKYKYGADPQEIQNAIDGIGNGFNWIETPQGVEYWEQVLQNLESLQRELKPARAANLKRR
jgi:hypothetical protein